MAMFLATIQTRQPEILQAQADGFADLLATDPSAEASVNQQWNAQLAQLFPPSAIEGWTDMGYDLSSTASVFAACDALVATRVGQVDEYPAAAVTYMASGETEPWHPCGHNCHTVFKQLVVARGEALELRTLDATLPGSGVTWKAAVRLQYTVKGLQVQG